MEQDSERKKKTEGVLGDGKRLLDSERKKTHNPLAQSDKDIH